ncbi:MAG: hypothetical protein KAI39_02645 [Desulfobulbaceae bacterium]|nr:hypothetical protein [Desulfobulbaceae bacterium]
MNVEQIFHKAQLLDPPRLQELTDFLDFLLSKKQKIKEPEVFFPKTELESIETPSVYQGKPLSLNHMRQAIEWEAGQRT